MRVAWLMFTLVGCGRFDFQDETSTGSTADAPIGCGYECAIDVGANTSSCGTPVTAAIVGTAGRVDIDMTGHAELELRATICDPVGYTLHVCDSPTDDGGGGDAGSSSNDAEAYFADTSFFAFGNDYSPLMAKTLASQAGVLAASGCSDVVMIVRDQYVEVTQPMSIPLSSPYLLRLDPPTDSEGTPDALWYVGINRTYGSAARSGSGMQAVSFCLR